MKRNTIDYPHPVLNEYSKDYVDSMFSIEPRLDSEDGPTINIQVTCTLDCKGLSKMIDAGDAKALVRLTCPRTSLRKTFDLNYKGSTSIRIEKSLVADTIDLQAMIVAIKPIDEFRLPEFNTDYFGTGSVPIRKGDVLANEPGIKIKLNTVLEKNAAGIVLIQRGGNIPSMRAHYASLEDQDSNLADYITIMLPDADYENYFKLRNKKSLKTSIDRFLQASLLLPAITEAIGKLQTEELEIDENGDPVSGYKGTIWADSIYAQLAKLGIASVSDVPNMSNYELANLLLGNVTSDSINNLIQKTTDLTTIEESPS